MRFALVASLLFVVACGIGCRPAAAPVAVSNRPVSINDRPTGDAPKAPSKPMGEMTWTNAKGQELTRVADLQGKAVILDFWATFCPPCKEEIPHLNSLIAKHGDQNLVVVGLNVGGADDTPEKIAAFVKETKLSYRVAFADDALTGYVFAQQDDIPQTLVLDRNGQVVDKFVGFGPAIQRDLDAAVEKALSR